MIAPPIDTAETAQLLRLLGEHTGSSVTALVPSGVGEGAVLWRDEGPSGGDQDADAVVRHVRDCVAAGAVTDEPRPEPADGWQLLCCAAVEPDARAGALALARPANAAPWGEQDRQLLRFAAAVHAGSRQLGPPGDRDLVTGLANRREFLTASARRLEFTGTETVAVYLADLDRFKSVNDLVGYDAGNRMLRELGQRVAERFADAALVARAGDDMFGVIVAVPGDDAALLRAEELRRLLARPVELGGHQVSRTASVGVAVGNLASRGLRELIRQADDAIADAQQTAGNVVRCFDACVHSRAVVRSQIELYLRQSIGSDAFHLVFQPEFDLQTGALLAVEALVRWQHPTLGALAPDEFVPVAEQTDAIAELDEWVLREACRRHARWRAEFADLPLLLRVNMSPAQLGQQGVDVTELVSGVLAATGLPGEALCVEVTERVVPPDAAQLARVLRGLRALGVCTALDDFGTGHNSLAHLIALPVDSLKIDRGFVRGLAAGTGEAIIVEALVGLAGRLGIEPVAEGVETTAAAGELRRMGCRRAQGHLLSEPLGADELRSVLAAGGLPAGVLP